MSWARGWRSLAAVALAGALAAALTACQVRPLYAPGPTGVSVAHVLPAIDIAPPQTRPEQMFRNSLLFRLRGGEEAAPTRYSMNYRLRLRERELAIEQITGTPAALQLEATLTFVLMDGAGGVLLQDRITTTASYDRSTQEFANVRARLDAQERVANTLAESVTVRLASHFAR